MTCIIGLKEQNKIWIGADSATSDGYEIRTLNEDKVFRVNEFLFGFAGSPRISQIIQHHLAISQTNKFLDNKTFLIKVLIEDIRVTLETYGIDKDSSDLLHSVCIVGYRSELYSIYSDFQLHGVADNVLAVGSGSSYALGAMHVLKELEPRKRILKALNASAYFATTVQKPFKILSL